MGRGIGLEWGCGHLVIVYTTNSNSGRVVDIFSFFVDWWRGYVSRVVKVPLSL